MVFRIPIHTSGYESGICSHSKGQRIKRMINTAEGSGLGNLIFFRGRRILSFGQAVDLVIEQKDIQIKISSKQMNGVVAPNAEAVSISGHDPHTQLGPSSL